MWYPAVATVLAAAEPISIETARDHLMIDGGDAEYFDAKVARCIAAARAHVEAYCGVLFASQTVAIRCDSFDDFAHIPVAPVTSITSVAYVDPAGAAQTLSTGVYELRAEGLEAAIVLKSGQAWPSILAGSRITVTAVAGYSAAPANAVAAMLLMVGSLFKEAENGAAIPVGTVDNLLCNLRRGV